MITRYTLYFAVRSLMQASRLSLPLSRFSHSLSDDYRFFCLLNDRGCETFLASKKKGGLGLLAGCLLCVALEQLEGAPFCDRGKVLICG